MSFLISAPFDFLGGHGAEKSGPPADPVTGHFWIVMIPISWDTEYQIP